MGVDIGAVESKLEDYGFTVSDQNESFLLGYPGIEMTVLLADDDFSGCHSKTEAVGEAISRYMKGLKKVYPIGNFHYKATYDEDGNIVDEDGSVVNDEE